MRFPVDAQLPPALTRYLRTAGHEADHVADLGMEAASDHAIWLKAVELGAVLVTKDEDFVTLRALRPGGPPVVWIRTGNTTRDLLIETFSAVLGAIIEALDRGETVVEVAGP